MTLAPGRTAAPFDSCADEATRVCDACATRRRDVVHPNAVRTRAAPIASCRHAGSRLRIGPFNQERIVQLIPISSLSLIGGGAVPRQPSILTFADARIDAVLSRRSAAAPRLTVGRS